MIIKSRLIEAPLDSIKKRHKMSKIADQLWNKTHINCMDRERAIVLIIQLTTNAPAM